MLGVGGGGGVLGVGGGGGVLGVGGGGGVLGVGGGGGVLGVGGGGGGNVVGDGVGYPTERNNRNTCVMYDACGHMYAHSRIRKFIVQYIQIEVLFVCHDMELFPL